MILRYYCFTYAASMVDDHLVFFTYYIYICKTQIDVQPLIDVQSSNRCPILKYIAVFHFLILTYNYVTDVDFK
jgi:hypothetical protein